MERSQQSAAGFTLLELMIAVTILTILASIGVPQYVSALRVARVGKAKHELATLSHAIDSYRATHEGQLPLSLHQVGFGGKLDPWGLPYCYLNYADGTGDGLEWAVGSGLVDPGAFESTGASGGTGTTSTTTTLKTGAFWDTAGSRRAPGPQQPVGKPSMIEAAAAVTVLQEKVERDLTLVEIQDLTTTIATVGDFEFFTGVPTETTRRRDKYMFPLNTDYDLFSLGPDGATSVSLGEAVALDDVIRANDGGYYGTAAEY